MPFFSEKMNTKTKLCVTSRAFCPIFYSCAPHCLLWSSNMCLMLPHGQTSVKSEMWASFFSWQHVNGPEPLSAFLSCFLFQQWGIFPWWPSLTLLNWLEAPCQVTATHFKIRGRFKGTYELLHLRALKFSPMKKIHILQCMGRIFCVEFQRIPLKFHTKFLTHTLKDVYDSYTTLKFEELLELGAHTHFWNVP